MKTLSTDRMISSPESDAIDGRVVWVPAKSIWTATLTLIALIFGPLTFTWDAAALFVVTTAVTICAGHSVGMHRLLIHRAFEAPLWLERILVYLGTLVGMAGPYGMIYAHDIRDWAQRQRACHDLHAHRRSFFHDAFWQMHCAVALRHPPRFIIEPRVANDRFYQFLEKTWMAQQLPWALLFFALGGWSWVVWGIAVRVSVSLTGHWLVGHFAHKHGHQGWAVDGVAVQGYNVPYAGFVTFGEAYHGNHHAFPGSANLALDHGQIDLGWYLICALEYLGLARRIQTPETVGERDGLRRVAPQRTCVERGRCSTRIESSASCEARNALLHPTFSPFARIVECNSASTDTQRVPRPARVLHHDASNLAAALKSSWRRTTGALPRLALYAGFAATARAASAALAQPPPKDSGPIRIVEFQNMPQSWLSRSSTLTPGARLVPKRKL